MPETIRILIADDHPVARDGLAAMLATQPDFEVVGEASSGAEAVKEAEQFGPDLAIMDLEMPDLDRVEAIRQICVKNRTEAAWLARDRGLLSPFILWAESAVTAPSATCIRLAS